MNLNKWVLLFLVSCFFQSNCMKRKNNHEEGNKNKRTLFNNNNNNNDKNGKKDNDNKNQLIKACTYGNFDTIKLLITKDNANIKDQDGNSLLMINAINTNPDYDERNYIAWSYSDSQKSEAKKILEEIEQNRLKIAEYLIQNGTNINIQNKMGRTALTEAIIKRNTKMISLLLKYNIKFTDWDLIYTYEPHLLKILIDAGLNLDCADILTNMTNYIKNEELKKILIWNGAKVNSNIYENSDYSKLKEIDKDYINKINQKYNNLTKNYNEIILETILINTNLNKELIPIICDYYVEHNDDIQSKKQVLIKNILFNKIEKDIQNSTKLLNNISEIIANYSLRINGTDLENYCNEII